MMRPIAGVLFGLLMIGFVAAGNTAWAEECSGAVTAEEALRAEDARYAAQTTNDFAAMERMFGSDLVYIHSSAVVDTKASYIESMRTGKAKYKVMRRSDAKVRTYGCVAIITGTTQLEVTSGGEELSLELRFHSIWAKRAQGLQFVGWQATRVPPKQ